MVIKLRRGELIAGASGLLLFVFLFLPWYGSKHQVTETGFPLPGRDVTINAWQSFDFIDIVLLAACLIAVGCAALALLRADVQMRAALSLLTTVAGGIAVILVFYRVLVPLNTVEREIGLWLGLLAAAGIGVGGLVWMTEEGNSMGTAREQLRGVRPVRPIAGDGTRGDEAAPPAAPRVSPKPPSSSDS